ncbi:hypothetical protein DIPPA_16485 [Diplonema papillatum]|nr:hypothetical protein DIPPA_16485 [Diplonema papillatum]
MFDNAVDALSRGEVALSKRPDDVPVWLPNASRPGIPGNESQSAPVVLPSHPNHQHTQPSLDRRHAALYADHPHVLIPAAYARSPASPANHAWKPEGQARQADAPPDSSAQAELSEAYHLAEKAEAAEGNIDTCVQNRVAGFLSPGQATAELHRWRDATISLYDQCMQQLRRAQGIDANPSIQALCQTKLSMCIGRQDMVLSKCSIAEAASAHQHKTGVIPPRLENLPYPTTHVHPGAVLPTEAPHPGPQRHPSPAREMSGEFNSVHRSERVAEKFLQFATTICSPAAGTPASGNKALGVPDAAAEKAENDHILRHGGIVSTVTTTLGSATPSFLSHHALQAVRAMIEHVDGLEAQRAAKAESPQATPLTLEQHRQHQRNRARLNAIKCMIADLET